MGKWKKVLAVMLAVMLLSVPPSEIYAQEVQAEESMTEIRIDGSKAQKVTGTAESSEEGFLWTEEVDSVSYTLWIPQEGSYVMELAYRALESKSDVIQLEGLLEWEGGEEQFPIRLARPVEYGSVRTMENGDQVRAETWISSQTECTQVRLLDSVSNEPCCWKLPKGEVTLTLTGVRTDFLLHEICLRSQKPLPEYAQVKEGELYKEAEPARDTIRIQAEQLSRASESALTARYDRSDPLVEPASARDMLLNIAGGDNYCVDGQWMEWEFEALESGLYALRIKARQNFKNGLSVNRRIYLDGEIPFEEAENLAFPYSGKWQMVSLTDRQGQEALLYLSKGTHTLRMEVVPGPEAEAAIKIQSLVSELMDIYRSIVMITGVNPDKNREYELERDIPELTEKLAEAAAGLKEQKGLLENLSGSQSGELSSLTTLITQLDSFLEEPDTIPVRLSTFKGNIDALSSFLLSMGNQPLDLDYLLLAAPEEAVPSANGNLWEKFCFEAKALFSSFFPKIEEEEEALTVWVSLGRDQMQVIKDMTDHGYTARTGRKVEFSLVQQGVTEAILAGTSPDVVLFFDNQEIVNLAMRGALEPLDDREGFQELQEACQSQAFVPYEYQGETYGVPLTQLFPMMFVRMDILEELGLSVPTTWEELYAAIPVVQRKNMQIGIPSSDQTFGTMLWQQGQGYYNQERTATDLQNQKAVDVFTRYTRLYTDYDLPVTYDFFNRFRSGEMPLAIADYTEYNRLLLAAPELTGKWAMYPVPGTQGQEGIDNSVLASGGQGGYVLSGSEKKDEAAEFLLWFAEAEQQAEYASRSEALLGAIGRYAPANQEAFSYLPWLPKEQELICAQWEAVKENPQMPGSYYTKRNLANAFRAVVYDGMNTREALQKYAGEIDRELERKAEEYR